jgi:hypothetical protein
MHVQFPLLRQAIYLNYQKNHANPLVCSLAREYLQFVKINLMKQTLILLLALLTACAANQPKPTLPAAAASACSHDVGQCPQCTDQYAGAYCTARGVDQRRVVAVCNSKEWRIFAYCD